MTAVKPKKNLGQHFLKNEAVAQRIVDAIASNPDNVLEIGPGMGVLTKYLLSKPFNKFQVVEIDGESVEYLNLHYPELADNIIAKDFLTLDLSQLAQNQLTVIGNFPYNISSQ
ncbi:MAG: 16S rRNA (adenine(1518)-N(6)/adenine(1519)-N(6))-dimethyltransferase, partial [Bacteroidales bacterium]|nr:16S rRNA (adenine(1518)-N(6)/adenine(1519)-N(6))-dimethyltransferase [Bacteroidales bacterium]